MKIVVKNKDKFQLPEHQFFKGAEIICNPNVPDDIFVMFPDDYKPFGGVMYLFKNIDGQLYYHKIPNFGELCRKSVLFELSKTEFK